MDELLFCCCLYLRLCFLTDDDRQCCESKDDENSEQLQDALGECVRQHDFLPSTYKGKVFYDFQLLKMQPLVNYP
jgi:hypothetical protein